jgi:uncharacterized membrane protein YhiD involved in acid resistance
VNLLELERLLAANPQLDASQIVTSLLLALVLGVAVALTYRFSVPERVLSPTMLPSLILLAMIGAMVMMVIGNNIARAFSLVGALAIIRFRTRLRSAWDISFVFLTLVVGIACGVLAYRVAILGTLTITLTILALHLVPLAGPREDRIRMVRCDVASFEGVEQEVEKALDRHLTRRWLVEARSVRFGEAVSLRYRVAVRDPGTIGDMLREVANIEGVERIVVDLGDEGPDRVA